MTNLRSDLTELASAASRCLRAVSDSVSALPDDGLLDAQRALADCQRVLDSAAASLAAEVQHRSRRELGYQGLAQKRGLRTAEALVQAVTGSSSATARRLVRVGTLAADKSEPWLDDVLSAFAQGTLSAGAVDAIRGGLRAPSASVSPDALADAARRLLALAPSITVEKLSARAREFRDELDDAAVADREQERRARRFLHVFPLADGMTRIVGLLDPESAAIVVAAVDAATSPRRGGPRFVDPEDKARAERIERDERTTEQLALDALVELVDVAMRGESAHVLGAQRPAMRVLVTERDLARGVGAAQLEGQAASISVASAERISCEGGQQQVLFTSAGAALDLGRRNRYHSGYQRAAIGARDGGCLFPGCDRPPSWSEVHHIVPWSVGGRTSVADGVLLCRHHHMLMHNNGWRIERIDGKYWLHEPPGSAAAPVPLMSKSPTVRRLLRCA